jgi:hypothetical protein
MANEKSSNESGGGTYSNVKSPQSLKDIVSTFKENFLTRNVEIVPGLYFNQYETIKRIYFYSHNQFESGPLDDNGEQKYFYDMLTDRNEQATKNIDLDTKDVYIKSESPGSYLKSWLLRREFMGYAKTSGFGKKLNRVSDVLPGFGSVVWKKVKTPEGKTDTEKVDLINLINDPVAEHLKDGIVIERHLLTQSELREKSKVWGEDKVEELIRTGKTVPRNQFMTSRGNLGATNLSTVDETTPYYEVYEFWGEIPEFLYYKYNPELQEEETEYAKPAGKYTVPTKPQKAQAIVGSQNKMCYVMAIISGVDTGNTENVLFCKKTSKKMFPYKETHYRKREGRWLGVGNYELCFDQIEKANEITNRYFSSLRIALLHLFQTRDKNSLKNILTDLLDGDVIVTKSELTTIPTEIRGATEYKQEIQAIEAKVDRLCSSFEVVSGADLPSGTPFKLGAQQLESATKFFKYVQENVGLFLEEVFNEWLLPDFAKSLTKEHILDLIDDPDDLEMYYEARKKILQYATIKQYVLENNDLPDPQQLQIVGELAKDQIKNGPKQLLIEQEYYEDQEFSIKTVITGENEAKRENLETLSTAFQTLVANPSALQDMRLMKIFNYILEASGFSPIQLNVVNQTPTNPTLNPANQGGNGVERSTQQIPSGAGAPLPVPAGVSA